MKRAIIILSLVYGVVTTLAEDDALKEFIAGNKKFTAAVYKELIKTKPGNVIVSPLSAETVLALTAEGARAETAAELVVGLSLPSSKEKTRKAFQTLLPQVKKSEEYLKLLSANKIYVANGVQLEGGFRSIATSVYDSSIENVDFGQNIQAAQAINRWVEGNTNNRIKNLIAPEIINNATRIVLVNTLYFIGAWAYEFGTIQTRKKKFYRTKEDIVEVDTMSRAEYFKYYESPILNAKFLQLPYFGTDANMIIVLPNEIEGLASLERNLDHILQPQPFTEVRVDVELPKFTIETEIDFVPILKSLGVQRVFDLRANLTGLSPTHKDLFVSHVVQKAFISVDEAGTEAGAASAVVIEDKISSSPPTVTFHADRPFFYFIEINEIIIFAGRYTHI